MSNKRQKDISQKNPKPTTTHIRRGKGKKQRCDLINIKALVCTLLFTLSILCVVASAKLETVADTNSKQSTTETVNYLADENEPNGAHGAHGAHENQLEYETFYHSELKRLPYETINRILRDEQEPIFRGDDIDLRYHHARSLQPTHEVVRRSVEEQQWNQQIDFEKRKNLNLSEQNLNEFKISLNSTKYLDSVVAIDLSVNRLETIELSDFKNLLTVNLSHNLLLELPITSNSTIQLLNLNSNRIRKGEVPRNEQLRTLYLSGNNIENLRALNLSLLNALETLDLSCNKIKNLETTFFPRLMHNLKYLNLVHNRLGSISRETFYNLLSLNTLLLAHNDITFIDYETFLSLPNLQYLDLSHNQLKGESIRALQGIPDLVGLSVAYNPEMGESLQEFVASWSLKEVDASGTGLCQIPAALAQAVRTLKLADNWFKIINCGDLDSYPLLQHLDLSFSHIEDIEDDAMGRLEFLEILFLDHNQLRKVPISLPMSLEHLFLQHNEIMDVQVQAFQGLKNLKTLDLSHNKLLYLPALPLPKLLILNLQSSGLQGLNQAIVHSLPHLRDLLLEENPIKCSDLLGIAEWASPCRIAERGNSKTIDSVQIGNVDVGQQQQQQQQHQQLQTVARIDLKRNFVQTHNFYEKFGSNGGICSYIARRQTQAYKTPPNCAIELDDKESVVEVEKPIATLNTSENSAQIEGNVHVEEQQKLLPTVQHETTTEQINAHSNEEMKVYEHDVETSSDVKKKLQTNFAAMSKTQIENSTIMSIAHEATIQINAKRTPTRSSQMATKKLPTKNVEITTVTTAIKTTESTKAITVMPETTFSTINSKQKAPQITSTTLVPKTPIASTSELNNSTETTIAGIPTMTTAASNYAMQYTSTRGSLLERQRRVEVEQATMATINTPAITDKTLATTPMTRGGTKSFEPNIGRNDNDGGSSSETKKEFAKTFANSEYSVYSKTTAKGKIISTIATTTTTSQILATTTLLPSTQHKHVTMQLHVKDRHLIGTPLLTHHGENLLIESGDIYTTTKPTSFSTPLTAPTGKQSMEPTRPDINTQSEANNVELTTETGKSFISKQITTRRPSSKIAKKPHNEQLKKKLSLTMKKMTITTKHATPTIEPTTSKEEKRFTEQQHQHQSQLQTHHHHYTLNTPRENEVTVVSKSSTEIMPNTNHQAYLDNKQLHHIGIKHSTVNTPIINGHEQELQTFQEHNELEEASAAAAIASTHAHAHDHAHDHAHAHASTSAIVSKITKSSSTKTSTSAKWFDLRKTTAEAAHPGVVILLSFGLFVVLLIGLLHVYRCDIPWPLRRQRQQQRPYRMHQQQQQHQQRQQQQQQQQTHFNDDEGKSFLSYQSNCNNQLNQQRKWRLKTTQKHQQHQSHQPQTVQHNQEQQAQQQQQEQQQHQPQQQQQHQSPFHNLQVLELQQTSAVEAGPKYAKPTYKISSALGERSNSQTSSTCSPHSSSIFDDETFYIEMTTDIGHGEINADANALAHSDLLPMELLNVSKEAAARNVELQFSSSQALSSLAFKTSSIDGEEAANTLPSSSKLTPTTRKLGIW